jgi:hypothetical protein
MLNFQVLPEVLCPMSTLKTDDMENPLLSKSFLFAAFKPFAVSLVLRASQMRTESLVPDKWNATYGTRSVGPTLRFITR